MTALENLARTFPLMRGGGAFLVCIGLGIVAGYWCRDGLLKIAAGTSMVVLSY